MKKEEQQLRLCLAVLFSAPISCLLAAGVVLLFEGWPMNGEVFPSDSVFGFVQLGVFVGVPITVIVGLPLHAGLMRLGQDRMSDYIVRGAIVFLPFVLLGAFVLTALTGRFTLGALAMFGTVLAVGMLTGLIFWLIRRPDRDHALTARANAST